MNHALTALVSRLSYGAGDNLKDRDTSRGFVEAVAQVYERARNALEYRADNLVRRAAIERILKRRMLLNNDPDSLTRHLLTELRWARYLSHEEIGKSKRQELEEILKKYSSHLNGAVPTEWILKTASAEIEEIFNLNTDYRQFTFFAFQVIKQKIATGDKDLDLLVYFAVDKVYAGSDDEQILYHILRLAGENFTKEKLEEAWKLFNLAKRHKDLPRIIKFVRRQMPPLILMRDIYFYDPSEFKNSLSGQEKFEAKAQEVLETQLSLMSGKVRTAGTRSVIYVFLTKMILAFGLEVPLETLFYGQVGLLPLALNLSFPPVIMWITTMQIRLPNKNEQTALVSRTWTILQNFDGLKDEADVLRQSESGNQRGLLYYIFSTLYLVFFVGIFVLIYSVLGKIGFSFFSKFIFIFFLTIIAFFAYRIVQIAKVYSWKGIRSESSTFMEILSLPIIAIGSRLSVGLSKLNFLAFAFDFILEAPFKIILGFVDGWVQFLSIKKEEQIIE